MGNVAAKPISSSPLSDPAVQRCPYKFYAHLRSESPVYWDEELQTFIVSRYETLRALCQNHRVFSSVGSLDFPRVSPAADEVAELLKDAHKTTPLTVSVDPPIHTRYRMVMNRVLTPQRMKQAAPMVQGYVERFVQELVSEGGGDFVEKFAVRLPFAVICTMMGLPESMWAKMRAWADSYTAPLFGHITYEREIECAHLFLERQKYLSGLVDEYRSMPNPPDNLISAVAIARLDDSNLMSMADALSMIEQFVVAGAETTKNSLATGALLLAQRPDLRLRLRESDANVDTFVEECLRLFAPAQAMMRVTSQDVDLEGVHIPKGSRVMLRFGSGNTDESVFSNAEDVQLDRRNARAHLTFGYGIHSCSGAPLARSEISGTFRALRWLDTFELANGEASYEHMKAHSFMGLMYLNLRMGGPSKPQSLGSKE